jgi:hypothetical protein
MAKDHGPSIKDDERYEALRSKGYSKEKSARIANTNAHTAGRRGGEAKPYNEWSKEDLYQQATRVGIAGRSRMNKSELVDALRNH